MSRDVNNTREMNVAGTITDLYGDHRWSLCIYWFCLGNHQRRSQISSGLINAQPLSAHVRPDTGQIGDRPYRW